jgi:hypothetical protein
MLAKESKTDGHVDSIVVNQTHAGWEVRTERDGVVIKRRVYSDWHRVERAVQWFDQIVHNPAEP